MGEIEEIKKILKDHEKRIAKLESPRMKAASSLRSAAKKSINDMLLDLKKEGFFKQPKFLNDVRQRLAQDGHIYSRTSLSGPLQKTVQSRVLGRIEKEGQWAYVNR